MAGGRFGDAQRLSTPNATRAKKNPELDFPPSGLVDAADRVRYFTVSPGLPATPATSALSQRCAGQPRDVTAVAEKLNTVFLHAILGWFGIQLPADHWLGFLLAALIHITLLIGVVAVGAGVHLDGT